MCPPTGRVREGEVIFTVSELSGTIRQSLDRVFPGSLALEGELSNVKRSEPAGHYYFTLKDAGASLRGVMFRSAASSLAFLPKDGLHVLVRGRLSYYEPRGEIQLVVEFMGPAGLGLFHLEFQRVRGILEKEGLLSLERKRPIPAMPRAVALITSPQGAAIWDFLRICDQQNRLIPVVVVPARMQGSDAADDIVRGLALATLRPGIDVVVISRGGGSAEDLWAFNREDLARAILKCPIPVVTAIGHEVDVTVADLVADLRVATPTEAAKRVFFDQKPVSEELIRGRTRLAELSGSKIVRERARLVDFRLSTGTFSRRLSHVHLNAVRAQDRLGTSMREVLGVSRSSLSLRAGSLVHPYRRLATLSRLVDMKADQIRRLVGDTLGSHRKTLALIRSGIYRDRVFPFGDFLLSIARVRLALPSAIRSYLSGTERTLARAHALLSEADPEGPLSKGFFILRRASDGHVVSSGNLPEPGERIVARTAGLSLGLRLEESCPEVPTKSKS